MSKINDLIAKHCPQGVEFKAIGDFGELVRGNGMPKSDFSETGVGCIHYGQIYTYYGAWTSETISFVPSEKAEKLAKVDPGDLIITNTSENVEEVCKGVAWLGTSQIVTGGHATVLKHKEDPKYISYYLQTSQFFAEKKKHATGTKVIDVSAKSLAKIKIPIPPLEIQHEIVKVLDSFSALEAELEAELEARRLQYSHYREKLLAFDEDAISVRWMAMASVGSFIRGNGLQKKDFVDSGVGCIHYGQVYTHYGTFTDKTKSFVSPALANKLKKARMGDLIIAATSENDEDLCKAVAWLGKNEIAISGDAYIYRHSLCPKYVAYFFQTEQFQKQKKCHISGTKVKRVSSHNMGKFIIPVPSLEEQERIVSILDKFDALVNNLSQGLPAEIAARRQQYEYYRNQLLTFQELV